MARNRITETGAEGQHPVWPGLLHGWLKVRDRAKHLGEVFAEVFQRVWNSYHAPDRRCFGQRLRSLWRWATGHLTGVVLEKVVGLCDKRPRWSVAYLHPGGHRTSNMLDCQRSRETGSPALLVTTVLSSRARPSPGFSVRPHA